jgi:hypothetical protein
MGICTRLSLRFLFVEPGEAMSECMDMINEDTYDSMSFTYLVQLSSSGIVWRNFEISEQTDLGKMKSAYADETPVIERTQSGQRIEGPCSFIVEISFRLSKRHPCMK